MMFGEGWGSRGRKKGGLKLLVGEDTLLNHGRF